MTEAHSDSPPVDAAETRNSRVTWLFIPLSCIVAGGLLLWQVGFKMSSGERATSAAQVNANVAGTGNTKTGSSAQGHLDHAPASAATEPDRVTVQDIVGTWVLNDGIKRVIDIRQDGTASMDVTFDFFTSFRYGSALHLEIKWTLNDDNVFVHEITAGSPESGKQTLISDFGKKAYFKILSVDNGEMHLVDFDDPPEEYLWKRITTQNPQQPSLDSNPAE